MVVCLSPQRGLFARVNTKGWRPGSVRIERKANPFLDRDSHIECGAVFELDDYVIGQSIERGRGVVGRIARDAVPALLAAVRESPTLSDHDKQIIEESLTPLRSDSAAP